MTRSSAVTYDLVARKRLRQAAFFAVLMPAAAIGDTSAYRLRREHRQQNLAPSIREVADRYSRTSGLSGIFSRIIAKARVANCHLVPVARRSFAVEQKRKRFPGMPAAWFPGLHAESAANKMLASVAGYLSTIRQYSFAEATS